MRRGKDSRVMYSLAQLRGTRGESVKKENLFRALMRYLI